MIMDMFQNRGNFLKLATGASLAGIVTLPQAISAQQLHTLRVLAVPTDGAKATLYAQKAGLFAKRGIQADIRPMSGGAAIFAAVAGGSAEIGSGSLFPVFSAYSRGIPLRIIAPASMYLGAEADAYMFVQKNAPITTARDLNGKTIAGDSLQDVNTTAARAWVDQNGGDGRSLRVLELKRSEMIPSLEAGRIDAIVLESPFVQVAMASSKLRALCKPLDAIGSRFLLSCWVANVDFITKNPEVVNNYIAALAEAARYTNAHQPETVELVSQFTGQNPATIASGVRSITAETFVLADVQKPLDVAVRYGVIEKPFDVAGLIYRPK